MNNLNPWRRSLALLVVLAMTLTGMAFAQGEKGNVYGRVSDDKAARLPGVTITLSGIGAEQISVTDENGEFRFLGLDPGNYKIEASLEGFGTVIYEAVNVRIGRNTTIELAMNPAIEDTITVTTESPLLDERKITRGISVTALELQKIPTARDPWSVAGQTPGVLMDRINVGGDQSGQQSNFIGAGSGSGQNKFHIDGVDITDMSAVGASSTYFGFDQFEEMSFTTGGTDVTLETPGVQINMVTKRGTNEWRGSGSYNKVDGDWQASDNVDINDIPAAQQVAEAGRRFGNRINEIVGFGVEGGGFLWKDRIWIWGAYDENDIKNFVFSGAPDDTVLENTAVKLNAQITDSNSFVYTWNEGNKIKTGRDAGPSRPPETTWNQAGPSPLEKFEDTHVFSSKFFLTGSFSGIDGGFSLTPQGGLDANLYFDVDGVAHGSYLYLQNERPTEGYKLTGSYFFSGGSTSHELKFGYSHRTAEERSIWGAPGTGVYIEELGGGEAIGYFVRENNSNVETEYTGIWAQDTITADRLTINVGFRYDEQSGVNGASSAPANSVIPNTLPALDFQGNDPGYTWENISPRLGLTYALGEERKTLLRASYSRFSDQLALGFVNAINPVATGYAIYFGIDANGNHQMEANERLELLQTVNFDIANPNSLSSPNQIDPDLEAVVTDELLIGIDHSVLPEFVVGVNLTYRESGDFYDSLPLYRDCTTCAARPLTAADYVRHTVNGVPRSINGTLPDGSAFSVPVYGVRPGLIQTGGSLTTNTDRTTEYLGLSLTATKRLSNKWMLRSHFTYYDWTWNLGNEFVGFDDPTNALNADNNLIYATDDDGDIYTDQSGGSGGFNQFLNSRWSFNISGMYQLPWGINVSANISGREGYPVPYAAAGVGRTGAGFSPSGSLSLQLVENTDDFRQDNIYTFDARIDKEFQVSDLAITLSADIFNLFNDGTVIQTEYRSAATGATRTTLNRGRFGYVNQTIGPRVVRLGVRLAWK